MREEGTDEVGSGTGVLGIHGYDSDDARPSGAQYTEGHFDHGLPSSEGPAECTS